MKSKFHQKITLLLVFLFLPGHLVACTIFSCIDSRGHVWVGNNEDGLFSLRNYINVFPKRKNTKFGYFTLTFDSPNSASQGGVNEAGLFYDFNALARMEIKNKSRKKVFPSGDKKIFHHILGNFETVQEVVDFFDKYWFQSGFDSCQMHVADKHGSFGIISPSGSRVVKGKPFQVSTNFSICPLEDSTSCWRYPIAFNKLKETGASLKSFTDICRSTAPRGNVSTIYSNIHNLSTGEMTFFFGLDYQHPWTINIKDLLADGKKSYLIRDLFKNTALVTTLETYESKGAAVALKKLDELNVTPKRKSEILNLLFYPLLVSDMDMAAAPFLEEFIRINKPDSYWFASIDAIAKYHNGKAAEAKQVLQTFAKKNPSYKAQCDELQNRFDGRFAADANCELTLEKFGNAKAVFVKFPFSSDSIQRFLVKKDGKWTGRFRVRPGRVNYVFSVDGKKQFDPKVAVAEFSIGDQTFRYHQKYVANNQKQKPRKATNPGTADQNALKRFVGQYWNDKGNYSRTIYVKNNALFYKRSRTSETELVSAGDNLFHMVGQGSDVKVKFELKRGGASKMVVIIDDSTYEHSRFQPPQLSAKELQKYCGTFVDSKSKQVFLVKRAGNELIIGHKLHNDVHLQPLARHKFFSNQWFLVSASFEMDDTDSVRALTITNSDGATKRYTKAETVPGSSQEKNSRLTLDLGHDYAGKQFRIGFLSDPENRMNQKPIVISKFDSKGRSSSKIALGSGEQIIVLTGRTYLKLWLEPGMDLQVEKRDKGFQFLGSDKTANQLLFDSGLMTPPRPLNPGKIDFEAELESKELALKRGLEKLASLKKQKSVSERFELFARAKLVGTAASGKNMLRFLAKSKSQTLPKEFQDAIDAMWKSFPVYEDSAALLSPAYRQSLADKFGYLAEKQLKAQGVEPAKSPSKWTSLELQIQRQQLADRPHTHELLFARKLEFAIQHFPASDFLRWKSEFDKLFSESKYREALEQRFAATRKIDLNAIAKKIEFVDIAGKSVSFSELSDKIIYVDFWGTWCKPCVASCPDLNKLVARYREQSQVVFVLINLDDRVETWKQFVENKKIAGNHWKATGKNGDSKIRELFLVSGLPRYMLFGQGGKLISASAPSPGKPQVIEMIDKAIELSRSRDANSKSTQKKTGEH